MCFVKKRTVFENFQILLHITFFPFYNIAKNYERHDRTRSDFIVGPRIFILFKILNTANSNILKTLYGRNFIFENKSHLTGRGVST
jgi:hypothetical protein